MSSYTMQLREYIEHFTQYEEMPVRNRIEAGRQHLFDFEYPIFDEEYRNVFETHFIRNFYMREIGFENEGLFKFQLETWLLINMPYYNKLFESELLQYDVLTNVNNKETFNRKNDSTRNDNTDKTGHVTSKDTLHDEGTTTQSKTTHEDFDSTNTKTLDSTVTNDVTQHTSTVSASDETVDRDITTHSVSDGTTSQDTHQTSNGENDSTSFDRNLTSDTPDSRLQITTNDGSGVIEYASEIKENTSKGNQTSSSTSDTGVDGTSHDVTDGTNNEDVTTSVDATSTVDDKIDNDTTTHTTDKDVFTSDKDGTETINGSHTNDGTKDVVSDTTGNEKLNSVINNVEDYVNTKVGKFGNVTYPQLVKEYRESLLRIEKQIFQEANELFMLVY